MKRSENGDWLPSGTHKHRTGILLVYRILPFGVNLFVAGLFIFITTPASDRQGHVAVTVITAVVAICLLMLVVGASAFYLVWLAKGEVWGAPNRRPVPAALVITLGNLSSVVATYSYLYWVASVSSDSCFTESLSKVDAVYFTLSTLVTAGFGDIAAQSGACRLLVSSQLVVGIIAGVFLLGVLTEVSTRRSGNR